MIKIPNHLKPFIAKQNYSSYKPSDHACWRYMMLISIDFFKKNAHKSYLKGLEKTGISIQKIPRISQINKKLMEIGWGAVCVRGFIPPQVFMEFQSLSILPIAADMRSLKNLSYTPAPDIFHEAAGHAPIISDPNYSKYLKYYGNLAKNAIMTQEDVELYKCIRDLSDFKAKEKISKEKLKSLERNLSRAIKNLNQNSEIVKLGRMNWWTVEYGLIGTIKTPKIYGAGLLSSVAEGYNALTENVKKIPIDLNVIKFDYDITNQQPQLFVTKNFDSLINILKVFETTLASKKGGLYALKRSQESNMVNTIKFDSGIQIAGILNKIKYNTDSEPIYLKFKGPIQLGKNNKEINNHGPSKYKDGFFVPIGDYKINITHSTIQNKLKLIEIIYVTGITITAELLNKSKKIISSDILFLKNCNIIYKDKKLFYFNGGFTLVLCSKVDYAKRGPIDYDKFQSYWMDSLKYERIKNKYKTKKKNNKLNPYYNKIRLMRESGIIDFDILNKMYQKINQINSEDWLIKYEILELTKGSKYQWMEDIKKELLSLSSKNSDLGRVIRRGLYLLKIGCS